MGDILLIIVPIFGLIAIGAVAAKARYLPASSPDALLAFVFGLAMPALLFRTIVTADFGGASPVALWFAYFAGVVVVMTLATFGARRIAGLDRRASVIAGVATSFANLVLVAIPMTERIFGRPGLDILTLLLAVHLPAMVMASTLLVERAAMLDAREGLTEGETFSYRAALGRIWRALSRNPLIIGILIGVGWRLAGVPLSGAFADIVDSVAATAGPLALIALGLSLPRYSLGRDLKLPALFSALALLVQPAVVFLAGYWLLPPLWLKIAVLSAAGPSGVNAYLLAVYFKSGEKLAANVTLLSTILAGATLIIWIALLGI